VGKKAIAWMLAMGCLFVPVAFAAEQDSGASFEMPVDTIEIVGQASTALMRYQHIVVAMDAFERHISLAPASKLTFQLLKNGIGTKTRGVRVHLADNNMKRSLPLAIGKFGDISIPRDPAALADDAYLIVNRTKDALTIEPSIRSADLKRGVMRLGDLRLNCQVKMALRRAGLSFVQRTLAKVTRHGCDSMTIRKEVGAKKRFVAYIMRDGERVGHSNSERVNPAANTIDVPLNDASWSNDTLIEFLDEPFAEATQLH